MADEAKQPYEAEIERIKELMVDPVFKGYSEQMLRVRRNLMVFSVIAIIYFYYDLTLKDSVLFGLKFENIPPQVIGVLLTILILYECVNFLWGSSDTIREWHIRKTTTEQLAPSGNRGFGPDRNRKAIEMFNRNLTVYWVSLHEYLTGQYAALDAVINEGQGMANLLNNQERDNILRVHQRLQETLEQVNKDTFVQLMARLTAYEKGFWKFQRSQNLRWLLIDLLSPLVLALWALVLIWKQQVAELLVDFGCLPGPF